jgi:hypothetical protein
VWQVQKKSPGPNKTVKEILWCAAAAPRVEWYLNNTRQRYAMRTETLSLLPVGTTSNEALHAEINSWFRQTQAMHPSTLELKLKCLLTAKLMMHNAALFSPTTRQMSASMVLAFIVFFLM